MDRNLGAGTPRRVGTPRRLRRGVQKVADREPPDSAGEVQGPGELQDPRAVRGRQEPFAEISSVTEVVNACDAGTGGGTHFRLPLRAFGMQESRSVGSGSPLSPPRRSGAASPPLRGGHTMKPLEDASRSRSEADWIVGMNATRAYSVRFGRPWQRPLRRSCPDPDPQATRRARARNRELQAREVLYCPRPLQARCKR